ncbi:MAG: hypothetical protein ABSH49_16435 [Bryobacteraceae bacterium]|jgi:hypothetical protein
MWYLSPSEDPHDSGIEEVLTAVDSDLGAFEPENLEPGESNVSAKTLAYSKPAAAQSGPGSEYWLP